MGCAASSHARTREGPDEPASPKVRTSSRASRPTRSSSHDSDIDQRAPSSRRTATERLKSQASFGSLFAQGGRASRASNAMSTMSRRTSTASVPSDFDRRTSAMEDPLGIGKESDSVSAPTRWLLVIGTSNSGKSALIRQLKSEYDDFDETEALRFVKEVHKAALDACREVIKKLPTLNDEKQASADRILKLRRRAAITPEIARDIKELWADSAVVKVAEILDSPQLRQACKHFVPRVEELAASTFVPDLQDLLHIRVPTMGQQETKLQNFPGGALSLFETKVSTGCTLFEEHEVSMLDKSMQKFFCRPEKSGS